MRRAEGGLTRGPRRGRRGQGGQGRRRWRGQLADALAIKAITPGVFVGSRAQPLLCKCTVVAKERVGERRTKALSSGAGLDRPVVEGVSPPGRARQ